MKVKIEMVIKEFKKLTDYLEYHEGDIACEINDFGELRSLYVAIFDDEPRADD